jgi:hypothetical protein
MVQQIEMKLTDEELHGLRRSAQALQETLSQVLAQS